MATKGSAAGFAAKRPDHLLSEGSRWPPKGQQQVLQERDQITYSLRAADGHQKGQQQVLWQRDQITYNLKAEDDHQRVSSRFCSKETNQITYTLKAGDGHQKVSSRF